MRSAPLRAAAAVLLWLAPLPAQDECTVAIPLVDGANGPLFNIGSTTSASPPWFCSVGGNDVWFTYIASCSGTVTFDTCGSALDTVVQVLNATCAPCVFSAFAGCGDNECGLQSRVSVPATAGTLLYVRVGGSSGAMGTFGLNVLCTPAGGGPPDDECAGALPVTLGVTTGLSNGGYTPSTPGWNCAGPDTPDRWFQFTANCTCPHTIHTCSSTGLFDATLEVFSGSCGCSLTSVACNDDWCDLKSSVTTNMVTGQTYYIRVGGYQGAMGPFNLTVGTGINLGSIVRSVTSRCPSPATLVVDGPAYAGSSLVLTMTGATGLPFLGYGFAPNIPIPLPCGCDVISDGFGGLGTMFPGTRVYLSIPLDSVFIGVSVNLQGIDAFPTSGGCTYLGVPFGLTDIFTATMS